MRITRLVAAIGVALLSVLASCAALAQSSVGGTIPFHLIAANSNNSTIISPGNHNVYSVDLGGIGSAPAYLKLYDKATAPTCGTDVPVAVFIIPAASTAALGGGSNVPLSAGIQVSLGLGICVTAGIADNDNTAVAASSFIINIGYK